MKTEFIRKLAQALYDASLGKSESEIGLIVDRAMALCMEKKIAHEQPLLLSELERFHKQRMMIQEVKLVSARTLPLSEKTALTKFLNKKISKTIELHEVVDPTVGGGFKIQIQDTIIDATLKQAIRQLAIHLEKE